MLSSYLPKAFAALLIAGIAVTPCPAQESTKFELGIEQKDFIPAQAPPSYSKYPTYPAYQAPIQAKPAPPPQKPMKPLQGNVGQAAPQKPLQGNLSQPAPTRPLTGNLSAPPGVLPGEFLGVWQVMGSRSGIEALPQYQEGIGNIFAPSTANTWTIQGNPQQGYSLSSDTGVSTQLFVEKVQSGTAFLRYQHQIKNTMAQEAIVMQLGPGGTQFTGLQRISIVKPGEPAPRAKVTYQLIGRRMR